MRLKTQKLKSGGFHKYMECPKCGFVGRAMKTEQKKKVVRDEDEERLEAVNSDDG